jgi:hypothetical protein
VNDFDDLIGADVAGEERERLLGVHDLLVQAGPPPELPAGLQDPRRSGEVRIFRVPRRVLLLAAAVAVIGVVFGVGFVSGNRSMSSAAPVVQVSLKGTAAAPRAKATLDVMQSVSGNWPMTLEVSGLPSVAAPTYYVVWLVRHGKPLAPCGSFVVSKPTGSLTLSLNAPYALQNGDTWIVTRQKYGRHAVRTTVLSPRPV